MKWQTADWFFVVILLLFIAMHFFRQGARRSDGGTDGRSPIAGKKEDERHGPIVNM